MPTFELIDVLVVLVAGARGASKNQHSPKSQKIGGWCQIESPFFRAVRNRE